jgi:hypothetical protein
MASRPPRRDVFRYKPLLRLLVLLGAAVCTAGLVSQYLAPPTQRSGFRLYGLLALSLFFALGAVQTFRERIELRDHEILVVGLAGRRRYPRALVLSAKWEKGCPVALKLRDGTWATLPDTGHASTRVAGAIRAWLREGQAPTDGDP